MKNVFDYINDHENWIETNDLEILVESDDFNDLDDKSKSEIFYMTSFDMSSKEYTKLQEAIMWLGMDLKRLKEPNPYPESMNPNSDKIEPTADGLKM